MMGIATAVKTAAVLARNKESMWKFVGIAAALSMAPVFIITAAFLYLMSAFVPEGVLKTPEYFNGEQSRIFISLQQATEPFYEELAAELAEEHDAVIAENTVTYEAAGADGKNYSYDETPDVTVTKNHVPENLIIPYLILTGGMDVKTATVNAQAAGDFLEKVTEIKTEDTGNNSFLVENTVMQETQIAEEYFSSEKERKEYLLMCRAYAAYFDTTVTVVGSQEEMPGADRQPIFTENLSAVPLYLQYDSAWGEIPYGNGNIKRNGCCPTCLAMVFSYFHGTAIYPDEVAAWAGNDYYVNGAGTAWSIFAPAAGHWGLSCTNIGKNQNAMQQALVEGKLVVASMGPGTFTRGGHFIVLSGITAEGKIKVNDPNDNGTKQHINRLFEPALIIRECKNMWVFGR